jgi:hypothetical protein
MAIEQRAGFPHWRYFLTLDEDLQHIARYIEFSTDNLNCYSLELARVLMMASAEIDVVAKQLSERTSPGSNPRNIVDYRRCINGHYKNFTRGTVYVFNRDLELHPWSQWEQEDSPLWWRANNNVKHHRHTHYSEANLKNALNAVAALMLLVIHFYEEPARTGLLRPDPRVLSVGPPITVDRLHYDPMGVVYQLDKDTPSSFPAPPASKRS